MRKRVLEMILLIFLNLTDHYKKQSDPDLNCQIKNQFLLKEFLLYISSLYKTKMFFLFSKIIFKDNKKSC